ncbi:MAG TPA: hypothetical protein VGF15_07520, partial [Solirubrobacteraceae bacterium]
AIFALGATGRERREQTIRHIARLFGNGLAGNRGLSTVGLEATIGALWEILYSRALEHSTLDPSAQLVFVALAPFLGAERARAIAEAPLRGD